MANDTSALKRMGSLLTKLFPGEPAQYAHTRGSPAGPEIPGQPPEQPKQPGQQPAPGMNISISQKPKVGGVKDVLDTITGGPVKQPLADAAKRATGTTLPPMGAGKVADTIPKINVQAGAAKPAVQPAAKPAPSNPGSPAPMAPKTPPAPQALAPMAGKAITKSKETTTMANETDLAKSLAEMGELFKANFDALKALNGRLGSIETTVADLRKEMPVKDGAKYAKDTDHDATTDEQETQVHEAAPEAAVKTFTPDNKVKEAFAPKVKAYPAAPAQKTVNLEELVAKAVEARFAKSAPTVSTTPSPGAAAPKAAGASAEPGWKQLLNKCLEADRKAHGIFAKNPDPTVTDTGYRPGDDSVKLSTARFMAKARKEYA